MNEPTVTFRYWDYPEPGPTALAMLPPSAVRERFATLLADGDADEIGTWLETADIPDAVEVVLRRGCGASGSTTRSRSAGWRGTTTRTP